MRIDPPRLSSKTYELYRQELLAWREVTELSKEKQGIAIALSLPENDTTQIRGKVFDQICIDDLKEEDGLDTLIAFFDKHLKKDDLADGLEKFEEFEDFKRNPEMSVSEYIATFDARYRKIEKLKMTLPPEILAFKLLKRANISTEERMLVLTGMNYADKKSLYGAAKSSLQKFKGSVAEGQASSTSAIKLEPTFLAQQEEALAAAGYIKRFEGKARRWRKDNSNQQRGHRQAYEQTCSKKLNPVGPDGKVLTCRCCGSYRHFVAECPHNTDIDEAVCETSVSDEHIVL